MVEKSGRYGLVRVPCTVDRGKSAKFHWLVNVATITNARPTGEYVEYVIHCPLLPLVELGCELPRYTVMPTMVGEKGFMFVKETDRVR